MLDRNYPDTNGEIHNINLACMDSGYNTDEVFAFCAHHLGLVVPTKGASNPLKSRYQVSIIDKSIGFGLRQYLMDTNQLKNLIASRMGIDPGAAGSWNVYRDIDREYCDQICSEQKVEHKDKKGRVTTGWEKIGSHVANHLLDCETNNALAAEILGVRYLMEPEEETEKTQPAADSQDDNWLGVDDNWL
jgi:phage terminase large subunit GpA-like protein